MPWERRPHPQPGSGQQIGDLGLQLRLVIPHMLIGKRAVPAGVAWIFGPSSPIMPS